MVRGFILGGFAMDKRFDAIWLLLCLALALMVAGGVVACDGGDDDDDDGSAIDDDDDGDDDDGDDDDDSWAGDDDSWPGDDDDTSAGGDDDDTTDDDDDDIPPGQLTAGEWRDLSHWDFWRDLFGGQNGDWTEMEQTWGFYTVNRFAVVVVDESERPVPDVEVKLKQSAETIWRARTDNLGRAELFAGVYNAGELDGPYDVLVEATDATETIQDVAPNDGQPLTVVLDSDQQRQTLDLMFMIDTTGSMSDELSYLQAELEDVIRDVNDLVGQELSIRLSVNFYRDVGDDYVVRPFPFTANIETAIDHLNDQQANGGGDYPEAVEEALENAIFEHDWRDAALARLCFLVLDAPPHQTQPIKESLHQTAAEASKLGIRIVPLAASGVDKPTEFLLRFLDIVTGGTYVFLTNDSGIGGEHTEPTIGEYEVELLNELLVRLVTEAVAI
jgi:von Willebrand factor type A domain